jgi:glutathione S-transferase
MMELKYSPLSPYARKVLVVAHEIGLGDRLRLTVVDTRQEPEKIAPLNPLGKIPVLTTDDGAVIYDSPVICEYLDATFGGKHLLPPEGPQRWEVMTRVALADGLVDAAIIVRQERARRAEHQSAGSIDWQLRKVYAGLDAFESRISALAKTLDMGQIALGCALGYMPLRVVELEGLTRWPGLGAWYDAVCLRPSFARTMPVP